MSVPQVSLCALYYFVEGCESVVGGWHSTVCVSKGDCHCVQPLIIFHTSQP